MTLALIDFHYLTRSFLPHPSSAMTSNLPRAGLIITASVLVAAGIACYENDTIREWILNYRRKLAVALHSLGDEISPPSRPRSNSEDNDEASGPARRQRREEIVRLNRLEMIRQAREEGIAVDLDELVKLGEAEDARAIGSPTAPGRHQSFDDLVAADGTLRQPEMSQTTGTDTGASGVRHRGPGARGLDSGIRLANPFDDEAQVLFDRELIGNSVHDEKSRESRESTRTLSPRPMESSLTESQYYSEDEMEAQIEEAVRRSLQDDTINKHPAAQDDDDDDMDVDPPVSVPQSLESSYYYAPPPNVHQPPASAQSLYSSAMEAMLQANLQNAPADDADDEAHTPTGTLTPTEDGQSTAASLVDSQAEDIGRMSDFQSMVDEDEMDARSEATSEAFSVVGASTPGSWTDVESEAGEEDGHHVVPLVVSNTQ
jgi:hypothetical protein